MDRLVALFVVVVVVAMDSFSVVRNRDEVVARK